MHSASSFEKRASLREYSHERARHRYSRRERHAPKALSPRKFDYRIVFVLFDAYQVSSSMQRSQMNIGNTADFNIVQGKTSLYMDCASASIKVSLA
jgi:hypothetical protein